MEFGGNCTTMFSPEYQLSKAKGKDKRENILVFARVRPINSHERSKSAITVVDCPGVREVVCKERGGVSKTFTFDRVFGPNSKQIDVYKSVVSPLLEEVLQGYNCTVFAYGQTGTGKTFTMEGERTNEGGGDALTWESDPLAGIVPRAMSQLFDELRVTSSEFTVRVSLVEMYNEEVYDLLSQTEDSKPKTVRLFEDSKSKGSVHIQGLEEVIVHNKHEVYTIMERGSQMRKTASTLLNANSSRSHTVFTVTVHVKESNPLGEDLMKIGKLHLVDLAGSENIGRSGAVDKRAREAGNINQSLLTLGRVITALVERAPHIPYRESKLTRLLQDSLGGRTKTSIIATISPASINIEETLSTLDYAHRAKNIQNRPEVNQKLTKKAMLREYTEEIERLRKDLQASREKNGIYVDKENYDKMMSQIESQNQDLTEKIQHTRNIEEQLEIKISEIAQRDAALEEMKDDLNAANVLIADLRKKVSKLGHKIRSLENEKEEVEHIVKVQMDTEVKLKDEASTLLNTAEETTVNLEALYNKLERKKGVERTNLDAGLRFREGFSKDVNVMASNVDTFREQHSQLNGVHRLLLDEELACKEARYENLLLEMDSQTKKNESQIQNLIEHIQSMNLAQAALRRQVQDSLCIDRSKIEQHKTDLSNHCKDFSTSIDGFKNQLYVQSGKLNEFWDSTYLVDSSTGSTPLRKAYGFPRELSATSPHDRILSRFRSLRMPNIMSESESSSLSSSPREDIGRLDEQNEEEIFDENQDPFEEKTGSQGDGSDCLRLESNASSSQVYVMPKKLDNRPQSDSGLSDTSTKQSSTSGKCSNNFAGDTANSKTKKDTKHGKHAKSKKILRAPN
ncbi:kinesin-like protein KIF11-A isoform X1 [Folsomia candida]|uniref:Kinesin-like protein n=1 Tax=Folsomia candida TaxID=158441 RepID=A0A226ERM7_FOLCA|nr:kinesin-like protein KIF11-A isoform X1 [Folsomia candida]OXA60283.1 Kinesin-like protein KIF11 [Folsomia candida]